MGNELETVPFIIQCSGYSDNHLWLFQKNKVTVLLATSYIDLDMIHFQATACLAQQNQCIVASFTEKSHSEIFLFEIRESAV